MKRPLTEPTPKWHSAVSRQFRERAEERLQRSRDNLKECAKLHREVRGEMLAIEARSMRSRSLRRSVFRVAQDLVGNPFASFQWGMTLAGPLEQLAREAEVRLARWPR